jgi:CheY-like chemotaxis protein
VYSEPGRGTTFKVLLPASAREAVRPEKQGETEPAWRGTGTVLLVDDEESVRALAARMLSRLGFTALTAADGREAVRTFRERAGDIACVIMDLTMPHMDGEEAFRELRRIRSDIPVLLSSGYNEQEAVQRFIGKGLAGFIQKPYTRDVLAAKLREIFEHPPAPPVEG